jgi:hypothetical protein
MLTKLDMTVVVPAPDEPVIAMTGCLVDMNALSMLGQNGVCQARASGRNSERSLNNGETNG